jgi:hypothetical protein
MKINSRATHNYFRVIALKTLVLIYFYVHVVERSNNSKMKEYYLIMQYGFCGGIAMAASMEYQLHYPD